MSDLDGILLYDLDSILLCDLDSILLCDMLYLYNHQYVYHTVLRHI